MMFSYFNSKRPAFSWSTNFFVLRFGRLSGLIFPNSSYATIPKSSPTKSLFFQDLKPQNTPPPQKKKRKNVGHLFLRLPPLFANPPVFARLGGCEFTGKTRSAPHIGLGILGVLPSFLAQPIIAWIAFLTP